MSIREFRASWRRLVFFFLCVAIGVGAIVALRSVIQSLRQGLTREARTMIASDVIVQTNRAWTPEVRAQVDAILAEAPILAETESVETPTMVRAEQGVAVARMVELRAVEAAFPFYGTLALADGRAYSHDLLADRGALVGPELLVQLRIARRRSADDRRPAVHDSRRDRPGTGPPDRRVQLRRAGDRRSRGSASVRPARVRQPRQLPAAVEGARGRRGSADEPAAAGPARQFRRPPAPTRRSRTTSATTSSARRIT